MKDGERSSERERERFVLKLVKKEEVAKRKEVPRDKRKHSMQKLHSNRSPNRTGYATITEAKKKCRELQWSADNEQRKRYRRWEIANTESSPRLFSRSTNHLRYFETNIISRVIFLISFLARTFKISSSMKGEQSGHLSEEAWREARHANRPYYRLSVVAGEKSTGCGIPRRDLVEPAFGGYHRPPALFRSISF